MKKRSDRSNGSERMNRSRGRLPIDFLSLPVLRVATSGVVLESNRALQRESCVREPVTGRMLEELVVPDDVARVRQLLDRGSAAPDCITLHFAAGAGHHELAFDVLARGGAVWLVGRGRPSNMRRVAGDGPVETKARFLSTMSHELRTPLNAVLGYAGLLRDGVYGTITAQQDRAVRAIVRRARDLQLLIDDVLALSRMESGRFPLDVEEFDPGTVVAEIRDSIIPFAREKDLSVTMGSSVRGAVRLDRARYKQVVLQLVANAVKFTPPHGEVELTVSQERDDEFVTRVRDTGIGIALADVTRIFDAFEQVESGTTRRFHGSGLGLSIANRIVRLLGGSIGVESEPGSGAVFTVTLPARYEPEHIVPVGTIAGDSNGDGDGDGGSDPTVVAIDDDPEVLSLLRDSLVPAHFRVAGARSGELGMQLARALHPVAITLDIMMPDKDGWQVLRELKADPQLSAIPVIVLSNLSERSRGDQLGAAEYLVKPVERNVLLNALQRLSAAHATGHPSSSSSSRPGAY